ncbi:2'-5' RNA ligase family protein [Flavobacterium sp. ST-87]|uniref:2'-5' RNA ligase family protein n=1 Tax=Flavobacterium plantiphilum TaxID=3163297 RepID=A0ABW8XV30_9FLAO
MDLKAHYKKLFDRSVQNILNNKYVLDPEIDSNNDNRYGITLLIRPSEKVKKQIQRFLSALKEVDNSQYYYPNTDIHITVLSIISCQTGFSLNQINTEEYLTVIEENLDSIANLEIHCKGITASDSAVMIQGFPSDESLNSFRDSLRKAFSKTNLKQSIDSRYTLLTAHSTVCRFRAPIENTAELIAVLEKYKHYDFGTFQVNTLDLVYNDWYQRAEKTQIIHQFKI